MIATCVTQPLIDKMAIRSSFLGKSVFLFLMFPQYILYNPLHDFLLIFVTAAACGDLGRRVGGNQMVGFLPRQLTCHHTQQVIGSKFTHSGQLLVMRLMSCQGRKPTT